MKYLETDEVGIGQTPSCVADELFLTEFWLNLTEELGNLIDPGNISDPRHCRETARDCRL